MKPSAALAFVLAASLQVACGQDKPRRYASRVPSAPPRAAMHYHGSTDRFATTAGDLVVTPLEHASLLFGWDGKALYVDPTRSAIDNAALPKADVVFLTHAHYDHLDGLALERLAQARTVFVGPAAVADKTHLDVILADGETRDVLGVRVTAIPMYNAQRGPAPGLHYHPRGEGEGYLLEMGGTRVYVSGDTECTPEMRALQKIDLAFVSMNLPFTMPPSEAAECLAAFRPKVVIPYHYRGSNLAELDAALAGVASSAGSPIEIRRRELYPRSGKLRSEAFEACDQGHLGRCEEALDGAKIIDPRGEDDPRVVRARQQIRRAADPLHVALP